VVLVADHAGEHVDGLEVARSIGGRRGATAVATDARSVGALQEEVIAIADLQVRRDVHAPEEHRVGGGRVGVEPSRAGKCAELAVPGAVRPTQPSAQVRGGFLGLSWHGGHDDLGSGVLHGHGPVAAALADVLPITDLGLADQREGDRRLEVERFRHAVLVHERGPGLAAEYARDRAVGMAQPERVAVAEEVALDEHADVARSGRAAHVEVQTALSRMHARVHAGVGLVVGRDRARVEGVGRTDLVEVVDQVDLDVAAELDLEIASLHLDALRARSLRRAGSRLLGRRRRFGRRRGRCRSRGLGRKLRPECEERNGQRAVESLHEEPISQPYRRVYNGDANTTSQAISNSSRMRPCFCA
jgi:hypothetical protein